MLYNNIISLNFCKNKMIKYQRNDEIKTIFSNIFLILFHNFFYHLFLSRYIYRKILCLYDVYNIVGLIMTFFNDSFRFMALYLIFFFYFYSISFNIATTCTFTFNINLLVFIKIMTN